MAWRYADHVLDGRIWRRLGLVEEYRGIVSTWTSAHTQARSPLSLKESMCARGLTRFLIFLSTAGTTCLGGATARGTPTHTLTSIAETAAESGGHGGGEQGTC